MPSRCNTSRPVLNLKAVLFDLGATLIKTASMSKIMKKILSAYGISRPLEEIALAFEKVNEQLTLEDYKLSYQEFWRHYNSEILKHLGIHDNLKDLADGITDEWWGNAKVELYPDVKETLTKLKQMGLKIGIVTNSFQTDIDEILSRTSLTGFFDVAVGADAVGKPKPEKEIFLHALEKLGVSPREALLVGDNLETDYEGARKAGLKPLLIERERKKTRGISKIQDLGEIFRYL